MKVYRKDMRALYQLRKIENVTGKTERLQLDILRLAEISGITETELKRGVFKGKMHE